MVDFIFWLYIRTNHFLYLAHFNVLLPALLFTSILDGVYLAGTHPSSENLALVLFPPIWGLLTPVCGLVIGYFCVKLIAKDKSEAVQCAAVMTIAFGNVGNLLLLLLSAMRGSYGPLSRSMKNCIPTAASLTRLFSIPWNILLWQPFFTFLTAARTSSCLVQKNEFSMLIPKPPLTS